MRRLFIIISAVLLVLSSEAQTQKRTATTQKSTATAKKPAATTRKPATKTTQRQPARKQPAKKTTAKKPTVTSSSIKGLQNQRAEIQKKIKQQEQALRANQADVKKRLANLMTLNSEIDERKKSIEIIRKDINLLDGDIHLLKAQLATLEQQLADRKAKYIKSMRYMARHRTVQDKLMFVFSSGNVSQMYRRLRFVRVYADYQKSQGVLLKAKQEQVNAKYLELEKAKGEKNTLLYKDQQEQIALQGKQAEQQQMVNSLQKQQKTIQAVITAQKKKDAALNAQIDKLIAEEVARARARAAAEAKRKAEEAAAAKKRAEELARKKREAEEAERENNRRIAEAKVREERLKAAAKAAGNKSKKEQERTEQAAREAEADRIAAERKANADKKRHAKVVETASENVRKGETMSAADRMVSGGFEANRGRLPMPITGSYRIVSHFGQYNVEGLKGVTLDNKGINILGSAGCSARCIYDGEVSAVYGYDGSWLVMVRHGAYISVYCNLKSVSVHRGQKVSTRQTLGTVGQDNILQFQLRKETAKLNPEVWLGR